MKKKKRREDRKSEGNEIFKIYLAEKGAEKYIIERMKTAMILKDRV